MSSSSRALLASDRKRRWLYAWVLPFVSVAAMLSPTGVTSAAAAEKPAPPTAGARQETTVASPPAAAPQAADKPAGPAELLPPLSWPIAWGATKVPLNFSLAQWDKEDGLPQDSVHAITQTRDGAMWIGTSEGAARYDGQRFTRITRATTRGFPTAGVTAIVEGPDGSMWFGTDDAGVVRIKKDGALARYSRKEGLRSPNVTALAVGDDGSVWIANPSGFNRFKDEVLSTITDETAIVGRAVHGLARTPDGAVLATSQALCSIRGSTLTPEPFTAKLNSRQIRVVFVEKGGARWLATNAEIVRLEGDQTQRFTSTRGAKPSSVNAFAQDDDGNIWVASNDGLLRFDGKRFVPQVVDGLDSHEPVHAVFVDREGSLWIGTNAGLRHLRRTAFTSFGSQDGLRQDAVSSICQDAGGVLWIGTVGQGLARVGGKDLTVFSKDQGLISDNIRALHVARDGSLLIGFDKPGLVRLRDGVATLVPGVAEVLKVGINNLFEDSGGALWLGTRDGLWRMTGSQLEKCVVPSHERLQATGMAEDQGGRVWVGTNHGLLRREAGSLKLFRSEDGLVNNNIRAVFAASDGVLWIGTTSNGLDWYKDGKFYHCSARQGLPSEAILALVDDQQGNLWVSTPFGISRAPKNQFDELQRGVRKRIDFETFTKMDGLRGTEVSGRGYPVSLCLPNGRLWFAMAKTVATVDPTQVPRNSVPPPVMITNVRVNDAEVSPSKALVLPAGATELEIGYTALSYAQPEKIRFRYRLEGVNSRWVDAGSRKLAAFSQVPPGKRRFRVQAMNNDGVWSDHEARLEIEIAPFFYQTKWFYVSAGAAALLLGFVVHRLRLRALRQRERELVKTVEERTAHLEAQIAERKRAQEALARSEALYESLVQILPLNLYRKDRDGRFTFVNDHVCRQLGRTVDELVGKTDLDIYPADRAQKIRTTDNHVMTTGKVFESEEIEVAGTDDRHWFHTLKIPVTNGSGEIVGVQGLAWDITPRKRAEEQAAQAQRELIEVSRVAGMAEVATNVLHNVGNVLNSVNVSVTVVGDRIRASKSASLGRVAEMLEEHAADLAAFMTTDPRAKALPNYLKKLSEHLAADQASMIAELDQLRKHVDHINGIVAMQQGFARIGGIMDEVPLANVVEDALSMNDTALIRHGIEVVRDFRQKPVTLTDRHKVLQILVNLVENAKHACSATERSDKRIVVQLTEEDGMAKISVADNGVGIAPENLTRIFAHGFTTRKTGHGFGLHSSALIAKELGGRIQAHSDGLGHGAVFVLELPRRAPSAQNDKPSVPTVG